MPIIEDGLRLIVGSRANNPLALHSSTLERRRQLHPIFVKVGDEEGVPWQLLEGIAATESAFRVDARNPSSGAAGLMQVMPFHFSRLGWTPESGWNDPEENIRAGARILKDSGLGRKPIKETLAAYSGHVTWLRTGKPPYPDKYVDDSLTRALYFWILEIGRMVGVE